MALKDLLKSTKAKPESPLTHLDRYLLSLNAAPDTRKEDGMFHPSSLSDCPRENVYPKIGLHFGDVIGPKLRRIFDNGSKTHTRIQEYLRDMGVVEGKWQCESCKHKYYAGPGLVSCPECKAKTYAQTYKEVAVVNEKLRILGHSDGKLWFPGMPVMLLEAKTINDRGWTGLSAPMDHHLDQATWYMGELKIKKTLFWYENKNNQEIKEFIVSFDEDRYTKLVTTVLDCIKALDAKTLPATRVCASQSCKKALDCSYREVCFSDMTFKDVVRMVAEKAAAK